MSRDLFHSRPALRLRLFRLAFALGHSLPYHAGMILAFIIGIGSWLADAQGRSRVRRNLKPLLPKASIGTIERTVRRSYVHCLLMLNETFRMARLPRWLISPRNVQIIDPYGSLKRMPLPGPAIICTVHVNWELLLAVGHHLGIMHTMRVVSRSNLDDSVDLLFDRMRAGHGARSLLLDKAPLASLRALREKRILGIVADRDYSGAGLTMDFAGRRLPLPVGPAALAVQTGAPIIPLMLARRGTCAFSLIVGKTIYPDGRNKAQQMPILLAELARIMDRFIHAVPSQWMAFHDLDGEQRHHRQHLANSHRHSLHKTAD